MYGKPEKHGFKVFSEDMRSNDIPDCLLMHGIEQFLVKWAVEALAKKYINPAGKSMDYMILDENPSVDTIIEACNTFSMFSQRRIVWVRDFLPLHKDKQKGYSTDDITALNEYIKNPNPGTILIFSSEEIDGKTSLVKNLKTYGKEYNFDSIDKKDLTSFARKRFKAGKKEIDSKTLNLLIDSTGYFNKESDYRLYNFENDINKIIAHSEGNVITERDIEENVKGDMETFVFDMLDGISSNRKDKAFLILHNMLGAGRDPFSIIGAIVSQFELMLVVKELSEDGMNVSSIKSKTGGNEFRIRKILAYVKAYSVENLRHILSLIYNVDRTIKTGLMPAETALEIFIAESKI